MNDSIYIYIIFRVSIANHSVSEYILIRIPSVQEFLYLVFVKAPFLHAFINEHQPHILLLFLKQFLEKSHYFIFSILFILSITHAIIWVVIILGVGILSIQLLSSPFSTILISTRLAWYRCCIGMRLRFYLVQNVPQFVFLEQFFFKELQDR